jgi:hypothetical protein
MEQHKREGLYNGLNALYGHDLAVARRELEWVEINLAKAPDLSPVAEALKEMVARLECS